MEPGTGTWRPTRAIHDPGRVIAVAMSICAVATLTLAPMACAISCEGGHWENQPYRMCTSSGEAMVTAPSRFHFPATMAVYSGTTCMDSAGKCTVTPTIVFAIPVSNGKPGMEVSLRLVSVESGMTYPLPRQTNPNPNFSDVSANIMEWPVSGEITQHPPRDRVGDAGRRSSTPDEVRLSVAAEMVIPETGEPVSVTGGTAVIDGCTIKQHKVCVGGD